MTSSALADRSSRGLREIMSRPVLPVLLGPPEPMTDMYSATSGSLESSAFIRCCRWLMTSKATPSSASVVTTSCPVSSLGKKPLGMTRNSQTVTASRAREKSMVARWWRNTRRRPRS